jgi:voltage-gated potassium channel
MPDETRVERRLDRAVDRATTPRNAAVLIAVVSVAMTVLAGCLMTVIDRENYPSIGLGLWWAVQTVTTVGYGDAVPTTVAGRSLAALIMLFGIGFLTVITAAITSTFVARTRAELRQSGPTAEQFERMDERLERIEAALRNTSAQ